MAHVSSFSFILERLTLDCFNHSVYSIHSSIFPTNNFKILNSHSPSRRSPYSPPYTQSLPSPPLHQKRVFQLRRIASRHITQRWIVLHHALSTPLPPPLLFERVHSAFPRIFSVFPAIHSPQTTRHPPGPATADRTAASRTSVSSERGVSFRDRFYAAICPSSGLQRWIFVESVQRVVRRHSCLFCHAATRRSERFDREDLAFFHFLRGFFEDQRNSFRTVDRTLHHRVSRHVAHRND